MTISYRSEDEIFCARLIEQVKPFASIEQRPSEVGEEVIVDDALLPS